MLGWNFPHGGQALTMAGWKQGQHDQKVGHVGVFLNQRRRMSASMTSGKPWTGRLCSWLTHMVDNDDQKPIIEYISCCVLRRDVIQKCDWHYLDAWR